MSPNLLLVIVVGVLFAAGVTDFTGYAVDPSQRLLPDLFLG